MGIGQSGQRGLFLTNDLAFASRQTTVGKELRLDVGIGGKGKATVRACKIDIAPVDADAVAGLREDGLLNGASLEILCPVLELHIGDGRLLYLVHCHLRCRGKIELDAVTLTISGSNLIGDVVDGS